MTDATPTADRLVSIAAGTLLDATPVEAIAAAAAARWPAAGVWFDPATWTQAVARDVRRALDDTGVIALDIEPIILSEDEDHGERIVDAAGAIGARYVLVASRRSDLPFVIERFGALCDRAAPAGVTLVLEFLPIFGIRTVTDAVAAVSAADRPNSGVLVDSLHLARSGSTPADLAAIDPRLLPYVQLADAPAARPGGGIGPLVDEALHGRLLLGDGGLPIGELVDAVPDVPLSFELRSRTLRAAHPDPTERARALLANWRTWSAARAAT